MTTPDVALFIDPLSHHFLGDRLFDDTANVFSGDSILAPYAHVKAWFGERGVPVRTADAIDEPGARRARNVYMSFGITSRYRSLARDNNVVLSALFTLECPIVAAHLYAHLPQAQGAFRRLYSFSTAEALAPFLRGAVQLQPFRIPQSFDTVRSEHWNSRDRAFLTMINANKIPPVKRNELYTERIKAAAFFAERDEIDVYGVGWDGPPFRIGDRRMPMTVRRLGHSFARKAGRWKADPHRRAVREAYRGSTPAKIETLSRYRFALCLENLVLKGWITEKIFDCMAAGTIPIYLGAPDITEAVPSDCFIDLRRFEGYEDLRDHLHSLSEDEVEGYRERARAFLASEAFDPFRKESFARLLGAIVEEDTGTRLITTAHEGMQ